MNGMKGLAEYIAGIVKKNNKENQAMFGIIRGRRVWKGNDSYDFIAAIDVSTEEGRYVYFLLTKDNIAVIVGA